MHFLLSFYSKDKLQELIRLQHDRSVIQNNEANIIAGALNLTNKTVQDIMTKIEDVYMLDMNTYMDFVIDLHCIEHYFF